MKKELLTVLLGTAAWLNLSAAPAEKTEVLPMDGFAVPARWSPAESSVTLAKEKINGRPTIKWVAPIDHFAGEKKVPRRVAQNVLYKFQPEACRPQQLAGVGLL